MNGDIITLFIAVGDIPISLTTDEAIFLSDCNIVVGNQPVYYGAGDKVALATQGVPPVTYNCTWAAGNSTISMQFLHLNSIFFKSVGAGAGSYVIISGTQREQK